MTNYPYIVQRPETWCAVCGASWTPQSVAVRFMPLSRAICGECIMVAAALVLAEQRRRAEDDKARRGQDAAGG
jgi:hypothetical protein